MKKYTKPSMEIVDLKVEENITAPTTFYRRGAVTWSLLQENSQIAPGAEVSQLS